MTLIWHYTSLQHGEKIFEEELLRVSEAERKFGLKPAIWFSKNPHWEPTATKNAMDSNGQIRKFLLRVKDASIAQNFLNAIKSNTDL